MNPTLVFWRRGTACAAILLAVLPTAAPAATIDKNTSFTGSATELVGSGGNYGPNKTLRFGPSATNQTFTINSGTLTDGTVDTGIKTMDILGTGNTVTFTGSSTHVIINNARNWQNGGTGNGSFHLQGTSNTMNVNAGATFFANGWSGIDGSANTLTVDGDGSKATFSAEGNDGFGNSSGSDQYTTNRINITNGGAVYVNSNGIHNLVADVGAGNYAVNVDGSGGRSVFAIAGIADMGPSGGGIAHIHNNGALETNADGGSNSNQFILNGANQAQKIFIDGGVLSYRNASAAQLSESSTGNASNFTWAGNNAFRLNNSASTDTGSYTLSSNLTSKNYTRLEMINGTTSVARAITVDGDWDGAILLDGTTATIANGVTLLGAATLTATGAASTLTGVVGGSGTLVKAGDGKLTLHDAPTYTGDTTVNAGTLALALANTHNESSVVTLAAGAKLELAEGVSDTVGRLYFGTDLQVSGTWGSSTSGATHTDDTYFAGKGTLTVTTGVIVPVIGVEQAAGLPSSVLTRGSSSVPFGDVVKGAAKTLTFTLKETGGLVDLTGIAVSAIGSSDYTVSVVPSTLTKGTSTTFEVTLTPAVVGTVAATTLHIVSTGISAFDVALTGAGIDGYAGWAQVSGLTGSAGSSTDPAFDADPNKDGVKNGLAWILGGEPLANALARLPHATTTSSGLTLTFKRRAAIGTALKRVRSLRRTWSTAWFKCRVMWKRSNTCTAWPIWAAITVR